MATSVQCRPQERTLGMVMKEVDEDLAMFLEIRRGEKDINDQLAKCNSEELDQQLGSEVDFSLLSNGTLTKPVNQDYLLNSENDKNDYDWLLSPPETPSNPLPEVEEHNIPVNQFVMNSSSTAQDGKIERDSSRTAPEPKISIEQEIAQPANSLEGLSSKINSTGQPVTTKSKNSSAGNGRPSSSGGKRATSTRSATPTGRPRSSTSKPSRASTPTSRPSVKPVVASTARSSTPTRVTPRSSTPTGRPSKPAAPKSASRSATPARRPSTPSSIPIVSVSGSQSSSSSKTGTTTLKKTAPSGRNSPTVKPRPLKPLETQSLSRDSSVNAKTLVPKRPSSASRGRPAAPGGRHSTTNGKPRRKSCSPSRGRATTAAILSNATTLLSKSRGYGIEKDDVNPVLIGTQMVERVVNMRKLAPPKQDDNLSLENPSKKSLSRENSGFGRSFSKKSLDMALRHMDIRRSVNGTLRPVLTQVSASSANGIRSSSTKNKTGSVSDSPLATSSNASSEPSINNSSHNINWSEPEDDNFGCERELASPTSQQYLEQ